MPSKNAALLANHTQLETRDFEITAEFTNRAWRPHRGLRRTGLGPFHNRMNLAPLGRSGLLYAQVTGGILLDGGSVQDAFTVATALEGIFNFQVGQIRVAASGSRGIVSSPTSEHLIEMPGTVHLLNTRISRASVERELSGLLNQTIEQSVVFDSELSFRSGNAKRLINLIQSYAWQLSSEDSLIAQSPVAALQAERNLVSLLLESQPHNYTCELKREMRCADPWQLRRSEEYIRSALEVPLTTGDIATMCGVSGRTIRDSFLKYRRCSPTQFVRKLRLEAVRRDLQRADTETTVSHVAARYNFTHFGRFSAAYREAFGELPSETQARTMKSLAVQQ